MLVQAGSRIESWEVLAEERQRAGHRQWRCRCVCGAERVVQQSKLASGRWSSCGCQSITHGETRVLIGELHAGEVVGELKVIGLAEPVCGRKAWLCRCACGVEIVCKDADLRTGATASCGCVRPIGRRAMYSVWCAMIQRCENEKSSAFKHYGGRGIKVCEAWRKSFQQFVEDVGERPGPEYSIDRIEVNGNYEPGNVRWATADEQINNRRVSKKIEHDGLSLTAAQWEKRVGIPAATITARLNIGWSAAKALTTAKRPHRRSRDRTAAAVFAPGYADWELNAVGSI